MCRHTEVFFDAYVLDYLPTSAPLQFADFGAKGMDCMTDATFQLGENEFLYQVYLRNECYYAAEDCHSSLLGGGFANVWADRNLRPLQLLTVNLKKGPVYYAFPRRLFWIQEGYHYVRVIRETLGSDYEVTIGTVNHLAQLSGWGNRGDLVFAKLTRVTSFMVRNNLFSLRRQLQKAQSPCPPQYVDIVIKAIERAHSFIGKKPFAKNYESTEKAHP